MQRESFGPDGRGNEIELITLENANGTQVKISTLGASLVSFSFKDKTGAMRDVVLGYDDPASYLEHRDIYFGATVGRCSNRIADAKVTIGGVEYELEANSEGHSLHSGSKGISFLAWNVERIEESENFAVLTCVSPHLEQGFPGNMLVKATYQLTDDDALRITYEAISDKETVVNLTNHSYFNLAGHDSGAIGGQKLKLYAKKYTPVGPVGSIPTGEILPVAGTPLDFTEFKEIGKEILSRSNMPGDMTIILHWRMAGSLSLWRRPLARRQGFICMHIRTARAFSFTQAILSERIREKAGRSMGRAMHSAWNRSISRMRFIILNFCPPFGRQARSIYLGSFAGWAGAPGKLRRRLRPARH